MPATPIALHEDAPPRRLHPSHLTIRRAALPETQKTRSKPSTPERGEDRTDADGVLIIDAAGDIILDVVEEGGKEQLSFRVNIGQLASSSAYFRTLLSSATFEEGVTVAKKHKELRERFVTWADTPVTELPHLQIEDVGRIGAVKSIKPLMKDFFQILHGSYTVLKKPPLSNIANLAVVADRFDAGLAMGDWAKRSRILGKAPTQSYAEEAARQCLLAGLVFGHEPWVSVPSWQLVRYGSTKWTGASMEHKALWWDLPRGLEDELEFRRQRILEIFGSIQAYILDLYISRTQQCKLGYDTSPQCDSFQLGEFVRFLARGGMLEVPRALGFEGDSDLYHGDLRSLLSKLRSVPSYRLDGNHWHCGPKKPLLQCLDAVEENLESQYVGICLACWQAPGSTDQWLDAQRPIVCNGRSSSSKRACTTVSLHEDARDFFLAENMNWSAIIATRSSSQQQMMIAPH